MLDFDNLPIGTTFYDVGDLSTCKVEVTERLTTSDTLGSKYKVTETYLQEEPHESRWWAGTFARRSDNGTLLDSMKEVHEFRINELEEKIKTETLCLNQQLKYHQLRLKELDKQI
jgi:hypothetical protein